MNRTRRDRPSKERTTPKEKPADKPVDLREQLSNGGEIGTIQQIQLPLVMITSLRGILLDIDPGQFRAEAASAKIRQDPRRFYRRVVRPMLRRNPVLEKAEVRISGQGLHVILRLDPAVEFVNEGKRQQWAAIVKVIQRLLPTDPDCPGITALTRPAGSINSKNGAEVVQLKEGKAVTPEEVLALFEVACDRPFHTIATILFGSERISPCPVCECDDSRLDVLDRCGMCYGSCGKVDIGQLFNVFLRPRRNKKGG